MAHALKILFLARFVLRIQTGPAGHDTCRDATRHQMQSRHYGWAAEFFSSRAAAAAALPPTKSMDIFRMATAALAATLGSTHTSSNPLKTNGLVVNPVRLH